MAKRRTYEEKLHDDLQQLEDNKWYRCPPTPAYDKFVKAVKSFIDAGEQYEFSNDYSKIRLMSGIVTLIPFHLLKELPAGITITRTPKGMTQRIIVKEKTVEVEVPQHYMIFKNGNLIAIE